MRQVLTVVHAELPHDAPKPNLPHECLKDPAVIGVSLQLVPVGNLWHRLGEHPLMAGDERAEIVDSHGCFAL